VRAPGLGRLLSNVLPGATAVTGIILLVNGLLFLLVMMAPGSAGEASSPGFGRMWRFDILSLIRFGAGLGPLTFLYGEWWRLLVPIFLHGGLLHFAFNSMALLQLGPLVEEEYGTERFTFIYLMSGLLGNVVSQGLRLLGIVPTGNVVTVGASGAIFGMIGLLLAHGLRRGGALRGAMLRYALYGAIISFMPGIDLLCHAGGFAAGLVLGLIVPTGPFRGRASALAWETVALLAVFVALVAFYLMATQGEQGVLLLQRRR
jgi:rhomboid protease GluP